MPAHRIGFTHVQVYTNSIGTAEIDVTTFHCGPIFFEWCQFTLVVVVKKCIFRVAADNEFVVLDNERMIFCFGKYSMNYGFHDELLGITVPHYVPDEIRDLVDNLRYFLIKADEKAAAFETFVNPSNFRKWLTIFMPTMTRTLCNGLMTMQLPKTLSFPLNESMKFRLYRNYQHKHKQHKELQQALQLQAQQQHQGKCIMVV